MGIFCLIIPIDLQNVFHKHVQLGHTFLFVLQHVSGSLKVPEFQVEFTRCISSKSQHHCYWHHRFQKLQSATQYVQGKIWWHWILQAFVRSSLTNRTNRVSLWALLLQVKMCMSLNSYWRKGPAFDFFSCSSIFIFLEFHEFCSHEEIDLAGFRRAKTLDNIFLVSCSRNDSTSIEDRIPGAPGFSKLFHCVHSKNIWRFFLVHFSQPFQSCPHYPCIHYFTKCMD